MSNPISYIRSSSGSVNGAVTDDLSHTAVTAIQRHLRVIAPLFMPFTQKDKYVVSPDGALDDLSGAYATDLMYVRGYSRIEAYSGISADNWAIALYGSAGNFLSAKSVRGSTNSSGDLEWKVRTAEIDDEVYFARVVTYPGKWEKGRHYAYAYAYGPSNVGSVSERVDRMSARMAQAEPYFSVPGIVSENGITTVFDYTWNTGKMYVKGADQIEVRVNLNDGNSPLAFFDEDGNFLQAISVKSEATTSSPVLATYRVNLTGPEYANACYAVASTYGEARDVLTYNWVKVYGASTAVDDAMARFNRVAPPGAVGTDLHGVRGPDGTLIESGESTGYYRRTGLVYVRGLDSFSYNSQVNNMACNVAFFDADGKFLEDLAIVPGGSSATPSSSTVNLNEGKYRDVYYAEVSSYSISEDGFGGRGITATSPAPGSGGSSARHFGTFSVLGDSYSTFKGYLVDESYATWYPDSSAAQEASTDVLSVEDTWWWKFATGYGCTMLENDSYSGSTICYDGYGDGTSDEKATSFLERASKITNPELILVLGGTNDAWVNAGMGDYKYSGWTETDLQTFRPALAKLIDGLQHDHVGSEVVFILNDDPVVTGKIGESVDVVCEHYGVRVLKLSDITKRGGHPDAEGMTAISNQLTAFLG